MLLAGLLLNTAPTAVPAFAQEEPCEFVLGFKALHDLIPRIAGDCVSNQESNPVNGDALQVTENGLMAWLECLAKDKPKIVLTHGENTARAVLADLIQQRYDVVPELPGLEDYID